MTTTYARYLILTSEFSAVPAAVGVARRHAERKLRDRGIGDQATEDIGLVVSELITNAIKAPGVQGVKLTIAQDIAGTVTVEVWDPSADMPVSRSPEADDITGRGLSIVSALSRHCGVRRERGGKTVFAVIEL